MAICITLEETSQIFSIAIPIVLLIWFLYSKYQTQKTKYFEDVLGTYAGYVNSSRNFPDKKNLNSGIILNIREIDNKGFFKGDFKYREIEIKNVSNKFKNDIISGGTHSFIGQLKFKLSMKRYIHPLNPKRNRIYKGRVNIIVRFDLPIDMSNWKNYIEVIYEIENFREMGVIRFKLIKSIKEGAQKLPDNFTLYKSEGYAFEPLKGVKGTIFKEYKHSL